MDDRAGPAGTAVRHQAPSGVRLGVNRLDQVDTDAGAVVLEAGGRAWAAAPAGLGLPVLVAGDTRVPASPHTEPVVAAPDGPAWVAQFRVPPDVARRAARWAVETERPQPLQPRDASTFAGDPPSPADDRAPAAPTAPAAPPADDPQVVERLRALLLTLRSLDRNASRLEERATCLVGLAAARAAAEERRVDAARTEARHAERLLGAMAAQRDEARVQAAAATAVKERLEAELARGRQATETTVARALDAAEVDAARARKPLEVAAGDRARLQAQLDDAVRERDELRGRLQTARDRDAATGPPPVPPGAPDAQRGRRRRAGTMAIGVLAGTGALLVVDAASTVLWQEPVSKLLAGRSQSGLGRELTALDVRLGALGPPPPPQQTPAQRMAQLAGALQATADPGDPLGRLRIPKTGDSWIVVQGSGAGQLRKGPGHYASTSLPGRPGTTAIAGHRTTYGAPFRHLDALGKGDRLVMRMPYGTFTYRVDRRRIVPPTDVSVLRSVGRPELVLTACHPLYSAKQRIVVSARLVDVRPRGAAHA